MRALCNREPLQHHDAYSDAKDVQALCEEGARRLHCRSFSDYLNDDEVVGVDSYGDVYTETAFHSLSF